MKIAINGFGRIGRLLYRQLYGRPGFDIVAINDLGDVANLAYLLKYDSVYKTWEHDIRADADRNLLFVDGKKIQFLQEKDPAKLPWGQLGIDVVIESTGA